MDDELIDSIENYLEPIFQEVEQVPEVVHAEPQPTEPNLEDILVFKTSILDSLGKFQGILTGEDCDLYVSEILDPKNLEWIPRNIAEQDENYKQIIPYCVITCANRTFSYSRTKKGNESRLHSMKSIGVGGHIERTKDKSTEESYEYSMWRELEEEIGLNKSYVKSNKIIGIINDDSDSVGRVHLGIVHHIKVNSTDFINNIENKLSNAGWEFTGYLNKGISGWENWSFFVINDLLKQLKNK